MRNLRENETPYGYEDITLDMYNQIAAEIDKLFNSLIQIVRQAKSWQPDGVRGWLNNLIGPQSENPYLREQFISSGSLQVYSECTSVVKNLVKYINENSTNTLTMGLIPALKQAQDKIKLNIKNIMFNPRKNPTSSWMSDEDKIKMQKWIKAWKYAKNKVRPTPATTSSVEEPEVEPEPELKPAPKRDLGLPTSRKSIPEPVTPEPEEEEELETPDPTGGKEEEEEGYRSHSTAPVISGDMFADSDDEIKLKDLPRNNNNFFAVGHMAEVLATIEGKDIDAITLEDIQQQLGTYFKYDNMLPKQNIDEKSSQFIRFVELGKKLLGEKVKKAGQAEEKKTVGRKRVPISNLLETILSDKSSAEEVDQAIHRLSLHTKATPDDELIQQIYDYLVNEKNEKILAIHLVSDHGAAKGRKKIKGRLGQSSFFKFFKDFYEKQILPTKENPTEEKVEETVNYYKTLLRNKIVIPKTKLLKEAIDLPVKDKIKYLVAKFRKII